MVLSTADEKCYGYGAFVRAIARRTMEEELRYVANEACFQGKKSSEQSRSRLGNCRSFFGGGRRRCLRIRSGCAAAEYGTTSRHHARRGRNHRRQPVDVLRLRQGKLRSSPAQRKVVGLAVWRLRALRAGLRAGLRQVRLRLRPSILRRLRLRRLLHILGKMSLGVLTATRPTSTITGRRPGPCLVGLFLLDLRRYPRASAGRRPA
jgi:hypothetical protein